MSRNNNIYTKAFTTAEITSETISEVWDFLEEGFTGLSGVTFVRDTENNVMYIYLDEDKKVYVAVKVSASGSGVLMEYYLDSEKCTYVSTGTKTYTTIGYLRTAYGIAWALKDSTTVPTVDYADFPCFYTQKNNPAVFVGVGLDTVASSTYYILSSLHESIESLSETSGHISTSLGDQKFIITNAYSCIENLNLRHFFRVTGIPSSNYPKGAIEVRTKKLFWFGRFALEYLED